MQMTALLPRMDPFRSGVKMLALEWIQGAGMDWFLKVFALVLLVSIAGCQDSAKTLASDVTKPESLNAEVEQTPFFRESAKQAGLHFVHDNGMTGDFHFPEIMGSGGALLDMDQDGDLDVYLCQGRQLSGETPSNGGGRLFRNDTEPGGTLRFQEVTAVSGLNSEAFEMGAASGDIDNDGLPDLYLLNYGQNRLWRNLGDGRFEDITKLSGTGDPSWSVSASFFDYDRDGLLDLFVVNYVDYTPQTNKDCSLRARDYCNPQSYNPVPDRLFRNLGGGRFRDVTAESQIATAFGNGLSVVAVDLDQDGWQDVYVANDGMPNQLWRNLGDGRFEDWALLGGAALNLKGIAEASMGVCAGDYDGDGDADLFMTHLRSETNTLFRNQSSKALLRFSDATSESGLGVTSRGMTAFGTAWIDADNDGWLDVLVVNGTVAALEDLATAGDLFPYEQPNQFFRNAGNGRFTDQSEQAGPALVASAVSRGAMFGDLDNDGDTDVVINNNHGPVSLLQNDIGSQNQWLGLRLVGKGGRDMLGARVVLVTNSGRQLSRHAQTDGSYAVANDPRLLIGLGAETASLAQITWPDGQTESFTIKASRTWLTLHQGKGIKP